MNLKKLLLFSLIIVLTLISCSKNGNNNISNIPAGISGSMARMIVVGNYMYVVDNQNLKTFDIVEASNPIETDAKEIGFGIETIFPFANYLFIGSTEGMYIYDITNPEKPIPASAEKVEHFTACDPVVANNNFAYVTLNSINTSCGRLTEVNEMQIVDIQNILNPTVVKVISMQGPKGLGLDGINLFVCDRDLGVIVFDLSNPTLPFALDTLTGFTANDLIPDNGNLLVVCEDGLRQFDYTDVDSVFLISYLEIND